MHYSKTLRGSKFGLLVLARLIQKRYKLEYSQEVYNKLLIKYGYKK